MIFKCFYKSFYKARVGLINMPLSWNPRIATILNIIEKKRMETDRTLEALSQSDREAMAAEFNTIADYYGPDYERALEAIRKGFGRVPIGAYKDGVRDLARLVEEYAKAKQEPPSFETLRCYVESSFVNQAVAATHSWKSGRGSRSKNTTRGKYDAR